MPSSPPNGSSTNLVAEAGPSTKKEFSDEATVNPSNLKSRLRTPSISSKFSAGQSPPELTNAPGFRAAEAYVRPSPIVTVGKIINYGFDLQNCIFNFKLHAHIATTDEKPTEIFLPEFHFPKDKCDIEVTGGKWIISTDDHDGGMIQRLRWWHVEGEHQIKVTGVRSSALANRREDEEGYYDQCQQSKCGVM